MKDQPTIGGRPKSGKQPDPADSAPTQISGQEPASISPPPRKQGDKDAGWAPFERSSLRFGAPQAAPPAEEAGETMVMEVEPRAPIPVAWLAIVNGPGGKRGKVITLSAETVIGRSQGNLLLSADKGVSSQHVRIRLETEASRQVFVAYDQASTNGTYIGNRENYRDESSRIYRRELKDGDYLLVGETTLVFKQLDE